MPNRTPPLHRVFHALADPTRLAVVRRLARRPGSTAELAAPFDMALPSFLQHLDVLEECGLVRSKKVGRIRTWTLIPKRLVVAEQWLVKQRAMWGRPAGSR
ncbi:MAG TPA: metalloregulator ArsR/SmtB family transcription factor [Gemmatimonadales bacterium]|nr:metalloregulator ArsR/SmtB family transcription factor [Gemmatimonadales bacterium]